MLKRLVESNPPVKCSLRWGWGVAPFPGFWKQAGDLEVFTALFPVSRKKVQKSTSADQQV